MSETVLTHVRLTVEPQTRTPQAGGPVELVGFHLCVSECDGSGNECDPPRMWRFPAAAAEARLLASSLLDYLDSHAETAARPPAVQVARTLPVELGSRRQRRARG